jgi:hypothetical protein
VAISEHLRARLHQQPHLAIENEIEVDWDERGNLVSPFVSAAVRGGSLSTNP